MTFELHWSRAAFASEHPNLKGTNGFACFKHIDTSQGPWDLRNADYDPKGGCCSSREKPLLSAAAGVSHAFFHDSGDFFDERVGDLIYLIRLSGSDSKKLWWIVTQERPMTYATVMVNLALDRSNDARAWRSPGSGPSGSRLA